MEYAKEFSPVTRSLKRPLCLLGALVLMSVSARAPAQTYYEQTFRPWQAVHWHIEAGYSPTLGQTSKYFDGGWTLGGGLTWQPERAVPLALRADLDYSYFSATRNLIAINEQADQIQIDNGHGEVFGLNVDGEWRARLSPATSAFVLAGVGVNHRRIALTQTVALGSYFCDPYFGYCGFGVVPGDVVVASADTTRFSWNAGAGLDFALRNGQTFFVEARYMRLETRPEPTEFFPITVGLRF